MLELLPADRFIGAVLNATSLPTHAKQYGYHAADEDPDETDEVADEKDEPEETHAERMES